MSSLMWAGSDSRQGPHVSVSHHKVLKDLRGIQGGEMKLVN